MESNTKLNPFIRIKGDAQRGKEVIAELERRGGENYFKCKGNEPDLWYHITAEGKIWTTYEVDNTPFFFANYEEIELPRWRAKVGEKYWYVGNESGSYCPIMTTDYDLPADDSHWEAHNYFRSEAEADAQAKADAINAFIRGDNKL